MTISITKSILFHGVNYIGIFIYSRLRDSCDYDQYIDLSLTLLGAIGHLEHFSFTNKPHISNLAGGLSADSFLEGFTKPRPMRILSLRLSKSVKTLAFLPQRAHTHARTHTQICNVCLYIYRSISIFIYISYTSPSPLSLCLLLSNLL